MKHSLMEVVVELQRGRRLIEESEGEMASLKTKTCMGRLGGKKEEENVLNSKDRTGVVGKGGLETTTQSGKALKSGNG